MSQPEREPLNQPDSPEENQLEAEFAELLSQQNFEDAVQADLEADMRALEYMDQHQATAGNVALVVTNLLEPLPLETMMAADQIAGEVVETESGCVVWRQLEPLPDEDFQALLGEERPVHPEADALAIKISQITPYGAVLFVSNLSAETDQETGIQGQITGRVYYDGKFDRTIPPGPMISCSDERLENLLLGRTTPADYPRTQQSLPRLRDMPAHLLQQAKAIIMAERAARRRDLEREEKRDADD